MTMALLLSAILVPLILALFATGHQGRWLTVIAPLPAIIVASITPSGQIVTLEWVLLGIRIGLDDTARVFLIASAWEWIAAAAYAASTLPRSSEATRFQVFFHLAMSGNFTLILAQDVMTFFLGFTLMGLSAYGLVAHQRSASAHRAGSLYLRWTILGEVVLFCALVLIVARSSGSDFEALRTTTPSHLAVALVVIGLGIKLALPGLHVWLPPAYCAAPTAGVAVLSGPMISAGLLGWMRFLPSGSDALNGWGETLVAIGIAQVVLGAMPMATRASPQPLRASAPGGRKRIQPNSPALIMGPLSTAAPAGGAAQ